MPVPHVNLLAVVVAGIVVFLLGGVWYSVLFARAWMTLMGKSEEEMKREAAALGGGAMAAIYGAAFLCGLLQAAAIAVLLNHFANLTALRGALVGLGCWGGFAAPTSFATALFSMTPRKLWAINSGYNLAAFVAAGILLAVWR